MSLSVEFVLVSVTQWGSGVRNDVDTSDRKDPKQEVDDKLVYMDRCFVTDTPSASRLSTPSPSSPWVPAAPAVCDCVRGGGGLQS